jgi:hypothetical protein
MMWRKTSIVLHHLSLALAQTPQSWVRYAKFELGNGEVALARRCYERAVEELGEDAQTVGCAEPGHNKQRLGLGGVFDPLEVGAVTQ